jgi:multiple sugar transport system substrate-binding protein
MRRSQVLAIALALLFVTPTGVLAGAAKKITLWYPAGDVTAGAAHFGDKTLFAEFEKKNNVTVEAVALDYDTMQQKIFAAAAGRNIADVLFIDDSWIPGFLKEEMLEPVADDKAKAWLAAVSPEIKTLSDYGKGRMWGYTQYGIDVYGLTWNKDHFKEAGLDRPRPGTSSETTPRSSPSATRRATSLASGTPSGMSVSPTGSSTNISGPSTAPARSWWTTTTGSAAGRP